MFMKFHAKPGHKPWLIAIFVMLMLAGGILLSNS